MIPLMNGISLTDGVSELATRSSTRSPPISTVNVFHTARLAAPASFTMSNPFKTTLPLSFTSKTRCPGLSPGGAAKPSFAVNVPAPSAGVVTGMTQRLSPRAAEAKTNGASAPSMGV